MNKQIYFIIIGVFLLISFTINVNALPNNTFQPDETVNYFVYCVELNNSICSESTSCELTAFNPDTSDLVRQVKMSYNGSGFFNYSLGVLTTEGRYSTLIHCNNSKQGVINSFFDVGIIESVYDNQFWFYVFLYLIPTFLIVITKITEDKWFIVLAGIVLVSFGIFLSTEGLPFFDNLVVETALWTITLGLGLYFMIKNGIELVEEGLK